MAFYHALQIDEPRCIGCSRCMKICPTEAVRIHGGKAEIQEHRCIDCGRCYEVCPVDAVAIKDDDFGMFRKYPHSVALLPSVFLGQFPDDISVSKVYAALYDRALHEIRPVSADIVTAETYKQWLDERPVYFFGNGAKKCMEVINHPNAHFINGIEPIAKWMQPLAEKRLLNEQTEDVAYFVPYYLKDFVALKPKKLL